MQHGQHATEHNDREGDVWVRAPPKPSTQGADDVVVHSPACLDEDRLKGVEGDAVVGPVAAGVHVIIALPVFLIGMSEGLGMAHR